MRLLPRSLFGRLVLVLLGGLILAQLATAYINLSDRDQLLYRVGGIQLAQRISDITRLLDSLAPAERRRVVAAFNAPPLSISLDRLPIAQRDAPAGTDPQLLMFTTVLRYTLGEARQVSVTRRDGTVVRMQEREWRGGRFAHKAIPGLPLHPMGEPAMPGFAAGGAFFVVQVALRDRTWVTFDSYLSPQSASMPLRLALTLLISLGTVIMLSLVAVRWATGPLSALASAAEELGKDINRAPLQDTGPLEVRRAARAFNTMQQRLSRFVADRTRILTAMSHDLKTPITRLRLRAEMLDDETLRGKIVKDLDEMQLMVTQTLDYMRDASTHEAVQRIDVMALLESLQTDFQDTGGAVRIDGSVEHTYAGRPLALRRCLTNLVDNAIRYGGRATIEIEDTPAQLCIRILDEGAGIPEAEIEQVFDPFFRGEGSRNRKTGGTGLGLGIARNIARAHGGDLTLKNRPTGGLEAMLSLPRRGPD